MLKAPITVQRPLNITRFAETSLCVYFAFIAWFGLAVKAYTCTCSYLP